MKTVYERNKYRVVANYDRNATVATFPTVAQAQAFIRGRDSRYEIQRAVEAEGGEILHYERTAIGSHYDARNDAEMA